MHQKQTFFHFHIFDLPAVTGSPNGIILMGFLIYIILLEITQMIEVTHVIKKNFLKTLTWMRN